MKIIWPFSKIFEKIAKPTKETKKAIEVSQPLKSQQIFQKSNDLTQPIEVNSKFVRPDSLTSLNNELQDRVSEFTSLKIISWKNRFVLIDFETANSARASICQIGMIVIENNQVTFEYSQLVKPEPFYFESINVEIHGITEEMVTNAKIFPEIWEDIKLYFNGDYIILAHNAAFDIAGVLKKSLNLYQLNNQSFNYGCTYQMIKKNPNLIFPNYRLETLAQSKNIEFQHHDALEDSLVLLKIINEYYGDIQTFFDSSTCQYQYRIKQITKNEG